MEKYITLLPYEVVDNVLKGRTVMMLDKRYSQVFCVNDMAVGELAIALLDDVATMRFEFWYTEVESGGEF